MPHICTRCNNVFQSGEDILKGCPVCGWKKFMFARTGSAGTGGDDPTSQHVITKAMGVRVPPGRRTKEKVAVDSAVRGNAAKEIIAENNIAREKAAKEELITKRAVKEKATRKESGTIKQEAIGQEISEKPFSPDIKRPEASGAEGDKLESIKITAPGTYELNLPSLFEREELIMAVKEGTYFIDLSSAFRKGKKE
jgi:uncharacterized protein